MTKQIENKQSRFKKLIGWIRRHKVTAALATLVLILAIYISGSWVVLQMQIHFEREQFVQTRNDLNGIYNNFNHNQQLVNRNYCFYSESTNEFNRGERLCTVRLIYNQSSISIDTARNINSKLTRNLNNKKFNPIKVTATSYSLNNYSFNDNGLNCSYDAKYYPIEVPVNDRSNTAARIGATLNIDTLCSKPAKALYFKMLN